jgi:WD40 repeat protein
MSRTRPHLTLQESRRFEGITGKVHCVAVSPDSRRGLSGSGSLDSRTWKMVDCTLRLWDLGDGHQEIRRFDAKGKSTGEVLLARWPPSPLGER